MQDELLPAEPFRIKMVEPIRMTGRGDRARCLEAAGYNPFLLKSEDVYIDLLTDSGTGAMSDRQWAALMQGDEAYAGSRSYYRLKQAVSDVWGFKHVIPTHQGRGAEHILCAVLVQPGQHVLNNTHFDTTRAHVQHRGGVPVDLPVAAALDTAEPGPFKGDIDLGRLDRFIRDAGRERIALLMVTITSNAAGGQPVSLANLRGVREIADRHRLPFYIDACRFAENAYFIQQREPGMAERDIPAIVREMMALADGCTMSCKKDALTNIGGLLCTDSDEVYRRACEWAVLFEGFPTYGGLAGRDLEAIACGLREVLDRDYLAGRIGQVAYLASRLREADIPIVEPPGGHAVYVDIKRLLPHLSQELLPGWAFTCELYLEGGVRAVEIGTVMAGRDPETGQNVCPDLELVRLAVPRRVYTDRHLDAVAAACGRLGERRDSIRGLRFVYEPPRLRHFTARFEPLRD